MYKHSWHVLQVTEVGRSGGAGAGGTTLSGKLTDVTFAHAQSVNWQLHWLIRTEVCPTVGS